VSGYLARRFIAALVLLWLVSSAVFLFVRLLPGDPALIILGASDASQPTAEQVATVRGELGLDKPLPEQYVTYLGNLIRGQLGESFVTGRPVILDLRVRLGRTLQIMLPAIFLASLVGIVLGTLAARARGRLLDPILGATGLVGYSVPVFVIGNVLVLIFAISLGVLPPSGYVDLAEDPVRSLRYMTMPIVALALGPLAVTMRMTRTMIVDELALDYVRTARAKGLRDRLVIYRHVLKNAMLPVVAVIGLQVGAALSGSVIVEYVFNWPGMGRLLLQSVGARDYPLIQGIVLLGSALFAFVNFVTDVAYFYFNPRLRAR